MPTPKELLPSSPLNMYSHTKPSKLPSAPPREPVCPACQGSGWLARRVDARLVEPVPCACAAPRLLAARVQRFSDLCGLDDLALAEHTFERYDPALQPEAFAAAQAFALDVTGWLILFGTPGTGKTHLLLAIARHLLASGRHPIYVTAPSLLAAMRRAFSQPESAVEKADWSIYAGADVLLIDDFGTQHETPWVSENLFLILNERYARKLPTAITMNAGFHAIEPRLASRMQDRRLSTVVPMAGVDYRTTLPGVPS